jgi:predicted nucleic acid-binding protein
MPTRNSAIYFDSAATTRVAPEVCAAMLKHLAGTGAFANASSAQHEAGRLAADVVEAVLDAWAALSTPVQLHYLWRPQLRDRNDDMVLETAVNGRARGIVTHHVKDFSAAVRSFQLEVWTPAAFLQHLRQP